MTRRLRTLSERQAGIVAVAGLSLAVTLVAVSAGSGSLPGQSSGDMSGGDSGRGMGFCCVPQRENCGVGEESAFGDLDEHLVTVDACSESGGILWYPPAFGPTPAETMLLCNDACRSEVVSSRSSVSSPPAYPSSSSPSSGEASSSASSSAAPSSPDANAEQPAASASAAIIPDDGSSSSPLPSSASSESPPSSASTSGSGGSSFSSASSRSSSASSSEASSIVAGGVWCCRDAMADWERLPAEECTRADGRPVLIDTAAADVPPDEPCVTPAAGSCSACGECGKGLFDICTRSECAMLAGNAGNCSYLGWGRCGYAGQCQQEQCACAGRQERDCSSDLHCRWEKGIGGIGGSCKAAASCDLAYVCREGLGTERVRIYEIDALLREPDELSVCLQSKARCEEDCRR